MFLLTFFLHHLTAHLNKYSVTLELQAKIQEIKKAYDVVVSENPEEFKVKSISSIVQGYASSASATNRTSSGKADHGWGINWPTEKWITK